MDYEAEVKAFYDWLETNPLTPPAINMWHALMHMAIKTGSHKFAVAVSVLEVKTGLKKKTIQNARNALRQAGRIEVESRSSNQSALYTICLFAALKEPQTGPQTGLQAPAALKEPHTGPQTGPHTGPHTGPQTGPINNITTTTNLTTTTTTTPAREEEPPLIDQGTARCIAVCAQELYEGRQPPRTVMQSVGDYVERLSAPVVQYAIETAVKQATGGASWKYVEKKLLDYESNGINSVEAAQAKEDGYERAGKNRGGGVECADRAGAAAAGENAGSRFNLDFTYGTGGI